MSSYKNISSTNHIFASAPQTPGQQNKTNQELKLFTEFLYMQLQLTHLLFLLFPHSPWSVFTLMRYGKAPPCHAIMFIYGAIIHTTFLGNYEGLLDQMWTNPNMTKCSSWLSHYTTELDERYFLSCLLKLLWYKRVTIVLPCQ